MIPLKNTHSSSKYLGCWLNPIQHNNDQYKKVYNYTVKFGDQLRMASLPRHLTHLAYSSIYISKLRYILPSANFTVNQIKNINDKLNSQLLPLLHINSKTPKAIIYGPKSHGGVGLLHIYNLQGYLQTKFILQIIRQNLPTKPLLLICIHQLQLEMGSEKIVLQNKIPNKNYISTTWISQWWKYLSRNELSFHNFKEWNI